MLKERNFPNTYTFTKNLGERLLNKNRGNVPLLIERPSIVGCSVNDPSPGWIDSLAAAGAFVSGISVGIMNSMEAVRKTLFDVTPVDYVINSIIVSTAIHGTKNAI